MLNYSTKNSGQPLSCWRVKCLHRQKNTSRFRNIWPQFKGLQSIGTDDEEEVFVGIPDPKQVEEFRKLVRKDYLPILVNLFNRLELLKPHYEACEEVSNWAQKSSNTTVQEVWEKVFSGGEGLYWTLRDASESDRSRLYRDAIKEIETKFTKARASRFGDENAANQVYDAFVSKALQIGLVMALDYLAYADDGDRMTKADALLSKLNGYTNAQWAAVLTELWPVVRPGIATDPKSWPTCRNVLLRMYDNNEKSLYSEENLDDSPDWQLCDVLLKRAAKAIFDATGGPLSDPERKKRAKAEVEKAVGILRSCGMTPLWNDDALAAIKKADEALDEKQKELIANG